MSRRIASLTVTAAAATVNLERRQIAGTLYRVGETGHTSAGPMRVEDPDVIEIPADLSQVALTREHELDVVRGSLFLVDVSADRCYVVCSVVDGPEGDAALAEAQDRSDKGRAALSWFLEDVLVSDDGVVQAGRLTSIGQVHDPAFNSARIDQVAASHTPGSNPGSPTNQGEISMTEEQTARLAELRALDQLTAEEAAELAALTVLEATSSAASADEDADETNNSGPASSAAARSTGPARAPRSVPVQRHRSSAAGRSGSALDRMLSDLTAAIRGGRRLDTVAAALSDITHTDHSGNIEAPAWSGELWSGLQYQPKWTGLLSADTLTNYEGSGWRWATKPEMSDYAGDKAAIPSAAVETEPSSYEAARMACGHDIDRKFYDFPNEAFLRSYAEAARESWAVKLDRKVRAYILAKAAANAVVDTPDTLFKAVALAQFAVEDNTNGQATFVGVARSDFLELMDLTDSGVPAFLDLLGVDPGGFVVDPLIPAGSVIAGVRQADTVRTLPGSPIRVDAQHIANGGVDSAFFGYWAIEEHHPTGIVSVEFAPAGP